MYNIKVKKGIKMCLTNSFIEKRKKKEKPNLFRGQCAEHSFISPVQRFACYDIRNNYSLSFLTATEKQKHLSARFNRLGMDLSRASLTLPKKVKKPSPDTISLIDSASSMESLSTVGLLASKQLSSSLLNINEGGGK